ncbi:hypothetical protein CVT25_010376 [Psilocybe cyanescens]|uniref:Beta-lactamase-related domain-containing protein n=1 Tax=Psilocybe cyanescens TaxID=93625 RepID=A0A409XP08_PSICY|nr:hypothetical protein CVT25_010376 [Psilocybe cyanescens]
MVTLTTKTKETLDAILAQAVADGKVPGASFAVGTADEELYFGAAGLTAFNDPSSGKVDEDSIFWVCSHTKLLSTVAALQLIEAGKLTYETPVEDIIPELKDPVVVDDISSETSGYKPAQNKILIKHLLNHTSGLYYSQLGKASIDTLTLGYTSAPYNGDFSVEQFFNIIRERFPSVPLAFEPGTNSYHPVGHYGWSCDILGFIIERTTGNSLHQYCKEHIFEPLDMKSGFYVTPEMRKKLVKLTYRNNEGNLEKWADQLGTIEPDPTKAHFLQGGIGLYTTLKDYLTLLRHLLLVKEGRAKHPILSVKTVSSLFESSIPPQLHKSVELFTDWENVGYGIGLCLATEDWPGRRKKGSGFWYGWAGTYYFLDPETGIAVVYGTQVVPTRDPEVIKLWDQLERALYAAEGI